MNDILLDYSEKRGWFLETGLMVIEMTDKTFQRHVEIHLQQQGITEPTDDDRIKARQYCRNFSFWDGCTDPEVRRRQYGGRPQ
jgi:hypothetical protein